MKKPFKSRLGFIMLSLLGFASACSSRVVDMYGTPHIDARAQGKVTNKEGQPIEGIEVRNTRSEKSVLTAADGSYDVASQTWPGEMELTFTDIDGPENGGEFATQDLQVKFTDDDKVGKGDGDWYRGSYVRTGMDVTMQEKE